MSRARAHIRRWSIVSLVCTFTGAGLLLVGAGLRDFGLTFYGTLCWFGSGLSLAGSLTAIGVATDHLT